MTTEPQGLTCPGCGHAAMVLTIGGALVVDSGQAFCPNEACHVFSWDPSKTLGELADNAQRIDLVGEWQCAACGDWFGPDVSDVPPVCARCRHD